MGDHEYVTCGMYCLQAFGNVKYRYMQQANSKQANNTKMYEQGVCVLCIYMQRCRLRKMDPKSSQQR